MRYLIICLVLLSCAGSPASGQDPTSRLATRYLAEGPTLIAPGLISTRAGEYNPTYDSARDELYFMRRTPGQFDYRIYVSRLTPDGWTEPVFAPFSGAERDDAPYLSPDGQTIVFDSSRPVPGSAPNSINLWLAERTPGGWSAPRLLRAPSRNDSGEPIPGRDEFGPVLDRSGTLHFYSFRQPYRAGRRYIALPPAYDSIRLAPEIPDPSAATFVGYFGLSTAGDLAVLEGRSRDGRDTDLFFSRRRSDGSWTDPAPIPGVNTRAGEGVPYLTSDGRFLLFTSDRPTTQAGAGNANLYLIPTEGLFR